jgi:hypothetical protein
MMYILKKEKPTLNHNINTHFCVTIHLEIKMKYINVKFKIKNQMKISDFQINLKIQQIKNQKCHCYKNDR